MNPRKSKPKLPQKNPKHSKPAGRVEPAKQKVWAAIGGGLYLHEPSKTYYERPWIERNGRRVRTYRSPKTKSANQAIRLLAQRRGRAIDARLGRAEDPYAKKEEKGLSLVVQVLKAYEAAGYLACLGLDWQTVRLSVADTQPLGRT